MKFRGIQFTRTDHRTLWGFRYPRQKLDQRDLPSMETCSASTIAPSALEHPLSNDALALHLIIESNTLRGRRAASEGAPSRWSAASFIKNISAPLGRRGM